MRCSESLWEVSRDFRMLGAVRRGLDKIRLVMRGQYRLEHVTAVWGSFGLKVVLG